jgi:hypothetical protein
MKNYQRKIDRLQHQQHLLEQKIRQVKNELGKEVNDYINYLKLLYPENHINLTDEFWVVQNSGYPCIRFFYVYDKTWYSPANKSTYIDFDFSLDGIIKVNISRINLNQKKRLPTHDYKVRSKIKIVKLLNDWILYGAGKIKKIPQI